MQPDKFQQVLNMFQQFSTSPLLHLLHFSPPLQVEPRPITLPPHGLTPEQLKAKRYGLQAVAPAVCQQLAPEMRAFKEWVTDKIRLDRGPGMEQSGNAK